MARNPECKLCPLYENSKHICLWGKYTSCERAEAMIVGMNPGEQEDRIGLPFVGPAGKELNRLLAECGMATWNLYITNAVKCRTIDNEEPPPESIKACTVYLREEIKNVKPKAILALGNVALRSLTGKSGIGANRNTELACRKDYDAIGIPVIVTYHPAALLRDATHRNETINDLRRFKRLVQGDDLDYPIAVVHDRPTAFNHDAQFWSYDIETEIIDLTRRLPTVKEMTMMQVCDGKAVHVGQSHRNNLLQTLQTLPHPSLVGWNSAKFDDPLTGLESDDAMLVSYLLDETGEHNLEACAIRYLGVRPWKHLASDPERQVEYGARDAHYTYKLWELLYPQLTEQQKRLYHNLLLPASRAFAKIVENGVYLNPQNVAEARAHYAEIGARAGWTLKDLAAQHGLKELNPSSPKQLAVLLFDKLSLPCEEWTETGQPSTAEEALKRLQYAHQHPALQAVLDFRLATKMIGTYLDGFTKFQDENFRVHPTYFLVSNPHKGQAGGTVTGRTSASKPAIQTVPREARIRRIIGAPPGKVLINADLSQIELRVGAWVANAEELIAKYKEGYDAHTVMAMAITGKSKAVLTKEERSRAKPVNFGTMYGAQPGKIQELAINDYGLVFTYDEARRYWELFHSMYPSFRRWYRTVHEELKSAGYVTSIFGRRRHLPEIYSADQHKRAEALRQAVNFHVQSAANDIALLATTILVEQRFKVVAFIHDSVLIECNEGDEKFFGKRELEFQVRDLLWDKFNLKCPVPLLFDVSVSKNWE